jgi:hypothetical protein
MSYTTPSPSVHLLDDGDNPLARLYNQVLRFVERDMKRIVEIAEKVSIKSATPSRADRVASISPSETPAKATGAQGFEIMANVIWSEVGKTVMEELDSFVFAAGNPNEFRQVSAFLDAHISLTIVTRTMRQHKLFFDLSKLWLPRFNPSRLCGRILCISPLSNVGSYPCTFS